MDNSTDPRIVLVMDELDAINFRKKGYEKPGCMVIPFNSEFPLPLALQLKKENLLNEGVVLVRSPYSSKSTYYLLEEATKKIHTDYFQQYASILALLGATYVSVEECSIIDEKRASGGSGNVGVNGCGADGSMQSTLDSNQKALMKLKYRFKPGLDLRQAKKLVRDYSLQNDRHLDSIIKTIEAGKEFEDFELELVLSKKLQTVFDLAASITPYAGIDIKAKMNSNKEIAESYELRVKVEFASA